MRIELHRPGPPLSAFVRVLWHFEGQEPAPHARESLLPTGTAELVVSLRDDRIRVYDHRDTDRFATFGGSVLCGVQSHPFVIDAPDGAIVGVHFRPGGAFPFFGPPAGELRDRHVSLVEVWGRAAIELRDRLVEADGPRARFDILESALRERATRLERHPAVEFALREFGTAPHQRRVGDVTERIGLSARRFVDLFRDQVGLTPKLYCRVMRFQRALDLVEIASPRRVPTASSEGSFQGTRRRSTGDGGSAGGAESAVDWVWLAQEGGYFDQSHLIRDFRAFSGLSPTTYLERRGHHLNHVPVAETSP